MAPFMERSVFFSFRRLYNDEWETFIKRSFIPKKKTSINRFSAIREPNRSHFVALKISFRFRIGAEIYRMVSIIHCTLWYTDSREN